jgi:hypothetical protein
MKNNLENQDIKTDKPVPMSYEALKAERDALAVENAALKDTLGYICNRGNEPEYHDCGMGCGLEDRGITDRYEAMYHGWESAMSRMYSDVIPDAMPETPATDAALAAIEARVWEEAKDFSKSMLATDSADHIDFLFDSKIKQLQEAK